MMPCGLSLALRERRAALEQRLLNRALRNGKGRLDQLITRLVMTQVPNTSSDRVPQTRLDRPE